METFLGVTVGVIAMTFFYLLSMGIYFKLRINGWGVERNHTHAEQLLIKAANAGNTDAARLLKLYKILGYFPISKR